MANSNDEIIQMKKIDATLGKFIRDARESVGKSQEQLSKEARLSRNYISVIELEKFHNLSIDSIYRLSNSLKVNPIDLFIVAYQSIQEKNEKDKKHIISRRLAEIEAEKEQLEKEQQALQSKKD